MTCSKRAVLNKEFVTSALNLIERVREIERERQREKDRERKTERDRERQRKTDFWRIEMEPEMCFWVKWSPKCVSERA
eukprot:2165228-Rhodomonas_salina.1